MAQTGKHVYAQQKVSMLGTGESLPDMLPQGLLTLRFPALTYNLPFVSSLTHPRHQTAVVVVHQNIMMSTKVDSPISSRMPSLNAKLSAAR